MVAPSQPLNQMRHKLGLIVTMEMRQFPGQQVKASVQQSMEITL